MLAVLPVQNLTGDLEREYISDGLTEEMIVQLGSRNSQRLGVIARTSSMAYKKTNKTWIRSGTNSVWIMCWKRACAVLAIACV